MSSLGNKGAQELKCGHLAVIPLYPYRTAKLLDWAFLG